MKKAFTLAEVLLVLMIVGVLLGLCMGAGRSSLDKAYSLYFYRSYSALNDAFSDFLARGKHKVYQSLKDIPKPGGAPGAPVETYGEQDYGYVGVQNATSAFSDHLKDLVESGQGDIKYTVNEADARFMRVTVEIPALRSKGNKDGKITYKVLLTTGFELAGRGLERTPSLIMIEDDNGTGMIDSIGTLPVYLDDGIVGKYVLSDAPAGPTSEDTDGDGFKDKFIPIVPMSFRDALCKKYASSVAAEGTTTPMEQNFAALDACNTHCKPAQCKGLEDGKIRLLKPSLMRF